MIVNIKQLMFFSFHLGLAKEVTKIQKYYLICLFTFFKSLALLAFQTETMVKKIRNQSDEKTKKNEGTKMKLKV